MTLREFFYTHYRPRRIPNAAANTIRLYEYLFAHFQRILGREPMLADLDEKTVADFLCTMATEKPTRGEKRAPRTVNKCRDQLLALANQAVRKRLIAEAFDILPLKEPRRIPIAFSLEQISALLASARGEPGDIAAIPAPCLWTAFILVAFDTGARAGALWAIERKHVDLASGSIFFPAENQKHGADQRLRVADDTLTAIEAMWLPDRDKLFPWPMSQPMQYHDWKRICKRAGLPTGRQHAFHKIRKTTATLCKRYGADATTQLGHSSDAITRRFYLAPDQGPQAADVMPRPTGAPLPASLCCPAPILALPSPAGAEAAPIDVEMVNPAAMYFDGRKPRGRDRRVRPSKYRGRPEPTATIADMLKSYRASLRQADIYNPGDKCRRIRQLVTGCQFVTVADIRAEPIEAFFERLRAANYAPLTIRNLRGNARQFVEWLLDSLIDAPELAAALRTLAWQPGEETVAGRQRQRIWQTGATVPI